MVVTPENAPLVVLGFLATSAVLLAAAATLTFLLWKGRRRPALRVAEGMGIVAVLYATALFAFSFTSRDQILDPGQRKYICEIDCHLAYSIAGVETAKILGDAPGGVAAKGVFYIVNVETWFDKKTISLRRVGGMPLWPNPRRVRVVDARGREFEPSKAAAKVLEAYHPASVPLDRPLRPGESYNTLLVFDLPEDVHDPRLWITEDLPVTPLLIGHEMSPFHGKIFLRIEPPRSVGKALAAERV